MDMRLDHAGDDQAARSFQFRRINRESPGDSGDRGALNADVNGNKLTLLQNAGVANNQVH
jgi:hypothetical protein